MLRRPSRDDRGRPRYRRSDDAGRWPAAVVRAGARGRVLSGRGDVREVRRASAAASRTELGELGGAPVFVGDRRRMAVLAWGLGRAPRREARRRRGRALGGRPLALAAWPRTASPPVAAARGDRDAVRGTAESWRRWVGATARTVRGGSRSSGAHSRSSSSSTHPRGPSAAAGTSGLPERIGGTRNYDYRFAWIRDSVFTLDALAHRIPRAGARVALVGLDAPSHASAHAPLVRPRRKRAAREEELPLSRLPRLKPGLPGQPRRLAAPARHLRGPLGAVRRTSSRQRPRSGDRSTDAEIAKHVCEIWRTRTRGSGSGAAPPLHDVQDNCWVALDRAIELAGDGEAPDDDVDAGVRRPASPDTWATTLLVGGPGELRVLCGDDELDCGRAARGRDGYAIPAGDACSARPSMRSGAACAGGPLLYRYSGHGEGGGRVPRLLVLAREPRSRTPVAAAKRARRWRSCSSSQATWACTRGDRPHDARAARERAAGADPPGARRRGRTREADEPFRKAKEDTAIQKSSSSPERPRASAGRSSSGSPVTARTSALLARGRSGLAETAREVERLGGRRSAAHGRRRLRRRRRCGRRRRGGPGRDRRLGERRDDDGLRLLPGHRARGVPAGDRGDIPRRGLGHEGRARAHAAARPRLGRPRRLGDGVPRHPAAGAVLRRQARSQGLLRVRAHRAMHEGSTSTCRWCSSPA